MRKNNSVLAKPLVPLDLSLREPRLDFSRCHGKAVFSDCGFIYMFSKGKKVLFCVYADDNDPEQPVH